MAVMHDAGVEEVFLPVADEAQNELLNQ